MSNSTSDVAPYRIIRGKNGHGWAYARGNEYPTECDAEGNRFETYETADAAARLATTCRPSQPPFTNVDSLGRGDHNPPIGALGDAIASLRPKSVAKRIAAQKGEPYPFEAQPASKALPRCEGDPETCRCAECRTAAHTAHLEARVAELEQFAKDATADCIKESAAKALAELRVAELEGALGNARGLLRRAVQSHMIRDLLGEFWVEDVSLWLNSKPVQSLDAARALTPSKKASEP